MKKILTIIIVLFFVTTSTNVTKAQTSVEEQYKASLMQIIELLQKQLAILIKQKTGAGATSQLVKDFCPNLQGIQTAVPEGMVYSRTHDKCLTQEGLDGLEAINDHNQNIRYQCREKQREVRNLQNEYLIINDKIETFKKKILNDTSLELNKEQVPSVIAWVKTYFPPSGERDRTRGLLRYNSNFSSNDYGEMPGMKTCLIKVRICYSEVALQNALEIIVLEDKLKDIESKITKAEIEELKSCR